MLAVEVVLLIAVQAQLAAMVAVVLVEQVDHLQVLQAPQTQVEVEVLAADTVMQVPKAVQVY